MESLRVAHFREVSRSKRQLEEVLLKQESISKTLQKLSADRKFLEKRLRYDKDGKKSNPISLSGMKASDPEKLGVELIRLYKNWKPETDDENVRKIGALYGFGLYIRREPEAYEDKGQLCYRYHHRFYAQRGADGIRYTYNNGIPDTENPKQASRHFLMALGRMGPLEKKYQKQIQAQGKQRSSLEQLAKKPFEKEEELREMKSKLSSLEREIAVNIQEKQFQKETRDQPSMGSRSGRLIRKKKLRKELKSKAGQKKEHNRQKLGPENAPGNIHPYQVPLHRYTFLDKAIK